MTKSQDLKFNSIENTDDIIRIDIAKKCALGRNNLTKWERAKNLSLSIITKKDKKDCITIARLIKDARFFEPYFLKT